MKLTTLKIAAIALVTAPMLLLTPSCAPECVDQFDCAGKAETAGEPYTCDQGVCKPGNPSGPQPDAGEGGGGGETGGGGGSTGGGGGTTDDGGTGGGTGDDGGTGGGGGTADDAGTGGGGGATGGGSGGGGGTPMPVDPAGSYAASLSGAQVVPADATTDTGAGTFTLTNEGDGGYSLQWSVTHTFGAGGGTREGGLERGLGGLAGTGVLQAFATITSPITGTLALSPGDAQEVAEGRTFVRVTRGAATIRGQIIRSGHTLWTAQLGTTPASSARGGAQFIGPNDGGDLRYLGAWTGNVAATASHIHQGGAAGSGGVVVPLSLTADAGGLAGSFAVADLAAGNTDGGLYVNVHTADAGNGLIRGQLVRH